MNRIIEILDLGICNYKEILDFQTVLRDRLLQKSREQTSAEGYLLLLEHNSVITSGFHADKTNILYSKEWLKEKNIEYFDIKRGGDVTFHGPGQLVVYPVINLKAFGLGVKDYVNLLEESAIRTVKFFGIEGKRKDGAPGVWIINGKEEKKISALGINSHKFCVMHGLSLNVNLNLDFFQLINPCGFKDKGVTSIKEESGRDVDIKKVKKVFSDIFLSLIFYF